MKRVELIVVGRGPAGIQAAIYAARSDVEVLVMGKDIGMLKDAKVIQTFLGYDSILGSTLIRKAEEQALAMGVRFLEVEVVDLSKSEAGFKVVTSQGVYLCQSLIIATGARRAVSRIRNLNAFRDKGVLRCVKRDAKNYEGKHVGVIGHGAYAAYETASLLKWTDQVTAFTNGHEIKASFDKRVIINKEPIEAVIGDEKVTGLKLRSGRVSLGAIVDASQTATTPDLAKSLGLIVDRDKIKVNVNRESSIPGVFAAGDCTAGIQQVAKAVGDGCTAGMNAVAYLRSRGQ